MAAEGNVINQPIGVLWAVQGLQRASPPCRGGEVCCDQHPDVFSMAASTVSFRITRNTEDLAQTIHLLSQRLVKLEQRLAAMELQLDRQHDPDPAELSRLDNVEVLLEECRQLLDLDLLDSKPSAEDTLSTETGLEDLSLAA
jgi:hypothetical protein